MRTSLVAQTKKKKLKGKHFQPFLLYLLSLLDYLLLQPQDRLDTAVPFFLYRKILFHDNGTYKCMQKSDPFILLHTYLCRHPPSYILFVTISCFLYLKIERVVCCIVCLVWNRTIMKTGRADNAVIQSVCQLYSYLCMVYKIKMYYRVIVISTRILFFFAE